jgi:hypothetical protein
MTAYNARGGKVGIPARGDRFHSNTSVKRARFLAVATAFI